MHKSAFFIIATLVASSFVLETPVFATSVESSANLTSLNSIDSRKDSIGYQYKIINGVLYRRLYNFSSNKPLSNWEKVE